MRRDWFLLSLAAACMLAAVGALAYGAGKTAAPSLVQAQQFELVDADGRVVAALLTGGDEGAQLRFWDGEGRLRMLVGLNPIGEPWLRLQDETGRLHVAELTVRGPEDDLTATLHLQHGASRGVDLYAAGYASRLELSENDSPCNSSLSVDTEGTATLMLSSPATESEALLGLSAQSGASLTLDAPQGEGTVSLDAAPDGRCDLSLMGKGGAGRAGMSIWPDGHSRLHLNDTEGEPRADLSVGSDGRPSLVLR